MCFPTWVLIKELRRRFNRYNIGIIAESKEKYISFDVKINVKSAGVKYKYGTEVCKNISLDKLASSLCGTSGIQCDKCKGNIELRNISGD